MSHGQSARLSIPADVVSTEIDGEAILLNLKTGQYYGLDEVGTRLWALLARHGQVEPVIEAMLEEYDVGEEELRQDVHRLVEELASHGLVKVDGG